MRGNKQGKRLIMGRGQRADLDSNWRATSAAAPRNSVEVMTSKQHNAYNDNRKSNTYAKGSESDKQKKSKRRKKPVSAASGGRSQQPQSKALLASAALRTDTSSEVTYSSDFQNGNGGCTSTSEYKESSDYYKEKSASSRRVSRKLGQVKPNR